MKFKALVIPLLLAAGLAGCSSVGSVFESKKIDYKSASSSKLPSLEVPPDLTAPSRDERYTVPDVGGGKGATSYSVYSAERATGKTAVSSDVLPTADKLRIERSGTQRWLVVPVPADKLWASVKEFWQDTGFIINVERPEAGVMETDWAENRAKLPNDVIRSTLGKVFDDLYSTAERDKFRTRLEPGAEPGTTEVYISHRGMYEIYTSERSNETRWQPRPPDPDLEAEMLRRLMVRLGVEESRTQAMLAAAPTVDRAKLVTPSGGNGVLELQESFDRAWRRVGLALDRVGFTVEDRDRSQGIYYVRYVDPEADAKTGGEQGGFLSKLMFWKGSGSAVKDANPRYRILVQGSGEASKVQVLTREGGTDTSDTSRKILNLLLEQLK